MNSENDIVLSGPFSVFDSLGRRWEIKAVRIVDESYAMIDVYVDLVSSMEDEPLYDDPRVIAQIVSRLRLQGYAGPDFGHADTSLQDDSLIVLEAPEEFLAFAKRKGWKNLAEAYPDDEDDFGIMADLACHALFCDLMQRVRPKN